MNTRDMMECIENGMEQANDELFQAIKTAKDMAEMNTRLLTLYHRSLQVLATTMLNNIHHQGMSDEDALGQITNDLLLTVKNSNMEDMIQVEPGGDA